MKEIVGTHNILMLTLDTLRYDVAQQLLEDGATPRISAFIGGAWQQRHTSGSFTYAAHQAFFAGFLPTPIHPRMGSTSREDRLFAARFAGSETTGPHTFAFDEADLVSAMRARGYHTVCIGGVGFFNKQSAISSVFPDLFEHSFWETKLGVTDKHSTEHQFRLAGDTLQRLESRKPVFLFVNISAIHQPNYFYLPEVLRTEGKTDNLQSHGAALQYVDSQWPLLCDALATRPEPWFYVVCSDHGTTYGDDGYQGHRLAHPAVWNVPYAEGIWTKPSTSEIQSA
ncbi:MAG: STM4013/SEN3800 family hydrolase [Candidatus Methylacidiphilales bacterium]